MKVYYLLTEAKSLEKTMSTFRKVFIRCWEKNIKLARQNLSLERKWILPGPTLVILKDIPMPQPK